jgi:hypothetical protein
MKWEEIIAEARTAGVLAFCADGVAVLKRDDAETPKGGPGTSEKDREQGRQSGQGKSESAVATPGS